MMTRLLTAIALVGALAAPAAAADKENLQLYRDIQKQVLGYAWFSIFDNVESQINESHARWFKPGSQTTTPMWPTGTITATSKWDGRALVSDGTQESTAGAVRGREVFTMSADGQTLTVTVTAGEDAKTGSTLVYTRQPAAESCKAWPTPCKI